MKKNREKVITLLGNDADFDGKLKFHGTARMDGHFNGEILGFGTLIVGEGAVIEATIQVSRILIAGEIRGDITADQRVDIRAPGKVYGNIQAPTVIMDEGASFDGNCKMKDIEMEGDEEFTEAHLGGQRPILSRTNLGTIHGYVVGNRPSNVDPLKTVGEPSEEHEKCEPLKDARVMAKCKGIGRRNAKTDAFGYYRLMDLEDGKWKVRVKAKGYEKAEAIIRVSGGGIYEQNFD